MIDLKDFTYYFDTTITPNIVWVELDKIKNLASPHRLGVMERDKLDLVADISDKFEPAEPFAWPPAERSAITGDGEAPDGAPPGS